MAGIFINYRRDDAPGVAGRLFDHLALKFSRRTLFMDVDAMKPGMDFAEQLDSQVSQCRVLLAVIGPRWFDAKDQGGHRRLDSDKDYVRIELASALKRAIPVIPVLVDGAVMPPEDSLSDDLKPLARRHALELRHTRFDADADAIVHALETVVPTRRAPWLLIGAGVAAVAIVAALAVLWPRIMSKHAAPPAAVTATPPVPTNPQVSTNPPPANPQATANPAPANPPAAAAAPSASPASTAGLPAGVKLGEILPGIAFRGSILRVTDIQSDPAICQAACRAETRCASWTYTQPSATSQSAHCSLKAVILPPATDSCCTSGIERVPAAEMRVPPPVPAGVTGVLSGVELEGGTYTYFGGDNATVEGCQAACKADAQCIAWDYMRPGIAGSDARCFQKNRTTMQVSSPCCIAGFEHLTAPGPAPAAAPAAASAAASGPLMNTNLLGSDYHGIDLAADNWALCQSACKANTKCLAWTLVHPGIQGSSARCWLKSKIPQQTASRCCISGIERAPAP
jgi:hypothetical protein